jgi:hypothetical protein
MSKSASEIIEAIALPDDFVKPQVKGDVDGNAFAIIGAVARTLRRAGYSEVAARYSTLIHESDSYETLLAVSSECVSFFGDEDEDE